MQLMEQYKNEAEGEEHSIPSPSGSFHGLGSQGMIRMPGSSRRLANPDAFGMAQLSEEGIEAAILGDLVGLTVSDEATRGLEVSRGFLRVLEHPGMASGLKYIRTVVHFQFGTSVFLSLMYMYMHLGTAYVAVSKKRGHSMQKMNFQLALPTNSAKPALY